MLLLEKTFEILAAVVRQPWRYPLVGLLLMVAVSTVVAWRASTPRRSQRWVVRKGVCPCCGSALFGTILAYQRFPGLDLVYPGSPLCPACDRAKVTALQRHYRLERADD